MIKLLIGGSPCTYWSIAKKVGRETEAEGMGWELFKNYLIAKEKFQPDFFLYENNKSAATAIKEQIKQELGATDDDNQMNLFTVGTGARYIEIDSALVSAQRRQRFYIHNCGDVKQPEDRGILLKDVLETGEDLTSKDKSFCLTSTYRFGMDVENTINRKQRTLVAEPLIVKEATSKGYTEIEVGGCVDLQMPNSKTRRGRNMKDKSNCLQTTNEFYQYMGTIANPTPDSININPSGHGLNGTVITTDRKARCLTTNKGEGQKIFEPIRVGTLPNEQGECKDAQATRIYSVGGKSVNLVANGGGQGAKTGLYAVPVNATEDGKAIAIKAQYYKNNISNFVVHQDAYGFKSTGVAVPVNTTEDGKSQTIKAQYDKTSIQNICCYSSTYGATGVAMETKDEPGEQYVGDGKDLNAMKKVYEVKNGFITIRGKQYPIKLLDGHYIIRKLSVTECCRLQTLPDDYCRVVSNSQAYKGLGNGWTAEVIIHILNEALKDVPRDEEIVVLSMYDGIGTGRYCLDKMGFTNIKYYAYEIDKYAMQIATSNYPDIIECGDAFQVREDTWKLN